MNVRAFIALFLIGFYLPVWAEGYGFDYNSSDIPNSSIYQMLYKPNVREDVPFTSIYSDIYDDGGDVDLEREEDSETIATSLGSLGNLNEFDTSFASDFKVSRDFFGTAQWTGSLERKTEKTFRCPRGYVSERLNAETLTMELTCSGLESGELDTTGGNAFLANSTDSTLQKFGDANSFVAAMAADSRRTEKLRAMAMNSGGGGGAAKLGLVFSDEMVQLLEKYAATSPGLREVLDEAIATGDIRVIYRRIQEAGGLESLMSQGMSSSPNSDFGNGDY